MTKCSLCNSQQALKKTIIFLTEHKQAPLAITEATQKMDKNNNQLNSGTSESSHEPESPLWYRQLLKTIKDKGKRGNMRIQDDWTPERILFEVCRRGDVEGLNTLLASAPDSLNLNYILQCGDVVDGKTPLITAVKNYLHDIVCGLVNAGADVNYLVSCTRAAIKKGKAGRYYRKATNISHRPLNFAVGSTKEIMKALLDAGADPLLDGGEYGNSPLSNALVHSSKEFIVQCVEHGLDINVAINNDTCAIQGRIDMNGWSILHRAFYVHYHSWETFPLFHKLFEYGARLNSYDFTPPKDAECLSICELIMEIVDNYSPIKVILYCTTKVKFEDYYSEVHNSTMSSLEWLVW